MNTQPNDLIREMRKDNFHIKSKHNYELDYQLDNQFNELKREIQQLQKNFEIKSRLKNLPNFIFECFEQVAANLDKDLKVIKEEIMNNSKE